MPTSTNQRLPSIDSGDLPERIFADNHYPAHVVCINSYSRPRYLIDILHILAGLLELQILLVSPLESLFSLPVRFCFLSGQLVHQLLCRQLYTPNCEEMWFVYAGQPLRFSLVEFEELTGLSCKPFSLRAVLLSRTTHADGCAPYWYKIIGHDIGSTTVDDLITLLKSEPTMPVWRKFRLALLVIVEGILLCRTQPVKPSLEVVEMVKDIDFFLHYPWGRHSFKRLLRMVTIGDYIADKPALIKFLPHSEDQSTFLDQPLKYLPKCKSYHTYNFLSTEHDPAVLFPFSAPSQFRYIALGDPKRQVLEAIVSSANKFDKSFSFGGDSEDPEEQLRQSWFRDKDVSSQRDGSAQVASDENLSPSPLPPSGSPQLIGLSSSASTTNRYGEARLLDNVTVDAASDGEDKNYVSHNHPCTDVDTTSFTMSKRAKRTTCSSNPKKKVTSVKRSLMEDAGGTSPARLTLEPPLCV
ncbi:PREDICTED: uncharacterized protein LOC104706920 [Camelina sativa]|uniref:Uncharacterized protein LOC104706920 n=1 Tax=Camelina sativa TaxID=90675 RepID=A0ABM0T670_CAMSA|nr:PREDICTED: uncharacterized protein LOC104706920 [Camelina sativa]XP_010421464.1 PREDICTED: uncharacterized protein LOC104706920 [Camelina sativa]